MYEKSSLQKRMWLLVRRYFPALLRSFSWKPLIHSFPMKKWPLIRHSWSLPLPEGMKSRLEKFHFPFGSPPLAQPRMHRAAHSRPRVAAVVHSLAAQWRREIDGINKGRERGP